MASSARQVFEQAAGFYLETAALVRSEQWDQAGLGQWSVRDLVGHTSRSLLTVETYLSRPTSAAELASPAAYFERALATIGDPEQVLQRGRDAGAALGPDPVRGAREIAGRVVLLVSRAAPDALVGTPVGGMLLDAYLPTRIFELTVHSLDLARAIGARAEPPTEALSLSLRLAAEMAIYRGRGPEILLALTGREQLPSGFSLL
ncbi:MAG: maleylpyruvate isomerase N-terminal domain-containing protein [Chloroflexi bacterium]|nr:maleylpyruvate isomerase N-terminal domain-containing protein [Chloroflexota bacterium]